MPTPTMSRLRQDEEGAITVLTGLSMMVVLFALAFAVDVGSLVLGTRDAQGVTDTAALDAVVGLGALATDDLAGRVQELAELSAAENGEWSARGAVPQVTTTVGRWDEATLQFVATLVHPNAVLVETTAEIRRPFGLIPGVDTVTHSAIAELTQAFEIGIGTSAASLDTDRAELLSTAMSGLFGGPVTLDAVGWQGLADTSIPLDVLMTELNVGTVEQLLDLEITAAELLTATASGLRADGSGLTVTVAHELEAIAAVIGDVNTTTDDLPDVGVPAVDNRLDAVVRPLPTVPTDISRTVERDRTIRLRDILLVEEGLPGAVARMELNVRELVTGTAMLVNGNNVVDLGLDLSGIDGIEAGTVTMTVVEDKQTAFGRPGRTLDGAWRTVARTGQLRFGVEVLTDPLGSFGGIDVGQLSIPIGIEAASGTAALSSVGCDETAGLFGINNVETTAASITYGATNPADLADVDVPLPPRVTRTVALLEARLDQLGILGALGLPTVPIELLELQTDGSYVVPGNSAQDVSVGGPFPNWEALPGPAVLPSGDGIGMTRVFDALDLSGKVGGLGADTTPRPIYNPLTGGILYNVDLSSADQLRLRDPLTGATVFSIDVRNQVIGPALDAASTSLQEVDSQVVRPLLDVLGVATIADAETGVLDHLCGFRQLVK